MSNSSNAISASLSITYKARAIVDLLIRDGQSNKGFESDHNTVITSIYAIADYLSKIESTLDNPANY